MVIRRFARFAPPHTARLYGGWWGLQVVCRLLPEVTECFFKVPDNEQRRMAVEECGISRCTTCCTHHTPHSLSVYRRADSLPSTIISITNNIIISIIIIIIVIAKVRTALCAVTARKRFMLETLPIESERLICIYIERKRCNRMLNRTKREWMLSHTDTRALVYCTSV